MYLRYFVHIVYEMAYATIYVRHFSSIQTTHITNAKKKTGTPNHFSIFYDQNDTKEIETERVQ